MVAPRKSMEPWIKDSVAYYDHQIVGVRKLARQRSWLLADEMGLGKSLQAITVFAVDIARGFSKTAIVVCPATLKGNWLDEFEKFTGIYAEVLETATAKKRVKKLEEFARRDGVKVLIVNYEQVVAHIDWINSQKFDVAIFDEAHFLKNPRAKRTKASLSMYSRRSFLLTGTPLLNQVDELWSILHRIAPSQFPKYWSFVHRYYEFGIIKNKTELLNSLNQYMLRRLKKDVLDLPEVQIIERHVDLLPEQMTLYRQVKEEMILSGIDGDTDITNVLTKFLRLKQICGTTRQFTGDDHSAKLDLAISDDIEILENGRKVVVFTQFRDVQEAYHDRIRKKGHHVYVLNGDVPVDQRQQVVDEWTRDENPSVLLCMFQVASIGLNMTAARDVSMLDKLYVPGLNRQAIDRVHRIGADTTQPIQVREYFARNTIDSRINAILRSKTHTSNEIIDNNDDDWKKRLVAELRKEFSKE